MKAVRWSDNDKYFGPFTFSYDCKWKSFAITIESGSEESKQCRARFSFFGVTIISVLPSIIKPWREWVDTSKYEWANSNGGYWDIHPKEYGFSLSEGFLQIFLGPQTHDSITTKNWCTHLPWTQWRFVRYSLYDINGKHWWTEGKEGISSYERRQACPSVLLLLKDYDGAIIEAKTRIEEREWLFGEGWFKWLSLFRKPKVSRSLSIDFKEEVGPGKGSWKGGTIGHGIDMLPGELHEEAFRRYCEQEHRSRGRKYKIEFLERP